MKQEGLKFFAETYLTSIGLMIFFLFFLAVVLWVYRGPSKELYKRLEKLPLVDGDSHE